MTLSRIGKSLKYAKVEFEPLSDEKFRRFLHVSVITHVDARQPIIRSQIFMSIERIHSLKIIVQDHIWED